MQAALGSGNVRHTALRIAMLRRVLSAWLALPAGVLQNEEQLRSFVIDYIATPLAQQATPAPPGASPVAGDAAALGSTSTCLSALPTDDQSCLCGTVTFARSVSCVQQS